jgi:hypothetical protein
MQLTGWTETRHHESQRKKKNWRIDAVLMTWSKLCETIQCHQSPATNKKEELEDNERWIETMGLILWRVP